MNSLDSRTSLWKRPPDKNFRLKAKFLLIIATLALLCSLYFLPILWFPIKPQPAPVFHPRTDNQIEQQGINGSKSQIEKIVVGVVSCDAKLAAAEAASGIRGKVNITHSKHIPLILIKSILLSAKVSGAKWIDFHIVTDSFFLERMLEKKIQKYNSTIKDWVTMSVHFYSARKFVPQGYERDFVEDKLRRCTWVRLFFPDYLPKEVEEILYLDSDIIITGNITRIWKNYKEKVVTSPNPSRPKQLAAMSQNTEVFGSTYIELYKTVFPNNIPHVPPRGVNAGVLFMNLEAMREFNWTEKVLPVYKNAIGKYMDPGELHDQHVINILFSKHLDRLTVFPCQYNFNHCHCDRGFACSNVTTDPGGIYIMHGTWHFDLPSTAHGRLYAAFKAFRFDHFQEVEEELYIPLRNDYKNSALLFNQSTEISRNLQILSKPSSSQEDMCDRILAEYLFKELAVEKTAVHF